MTCAMAWFPASAFFVSHRFGNLASAIYLVVNFVNQLTVRTSQWQAGGRDKETVLFGNKVEAGLFQKRQDSLPT